MASKVGKIKRLIPPHPIFFDWLNKVDIESILKKVQLALDDFLPYKIKQAISHKLRGDKSAWDYTHDTKIDWLYPSEAVRKNFFYRRKKGWFADRLRYGVVFSKNKKEETYKQYCQDHLIPGESSFDKILDDLNEWRKIHIEIIEELITGKVGNQKNNLEKIIAYNKKNLISRVESDELKIDLKYDSYSYESLIEWVETTYLLTPLLEKNEEFFLAIKKCEICSNFYFAYTNKAKYCSAKCKTAAYRQKKARLY